MSYKLVKSGTVPEVDKFGIHLTLYPPIHEGCEAVLVSTEEGHNQEFYDKVSTYTYIILEGNGTYFLNDEEVPVSQGDYLSIPPNTRIYYKGKMKMVLITTPTYAEGNDVEVRPSVW